MGRINKPNKTTPVSADEFIIYDSEDTSDDKNVTLGQIASFTESQDSTVTGTKIFTDGVELQKGSIAFGQYSPLPTSLGTYVAQYTHPTYGARILGYNGSAYQDLSIGSMPTAGTVSMKSLANGDCDFGYNVNIAEDLGVTGDITANKYYGDGSELTGIVSGVSEFDNLGTVTTNITLAENKITTGYWSGTNTITLPTVTDTTKQVVCILDFTTATSGQPTLNKPILTGTIAVTNASATVTGTSTLFTTELAVGSKITIANVDYIVSAIASNTSLTLTATYSGTTASGLTAYRNWLKWSDKNGGKPPSSYSILSGVQNLLVFKSVWIGSLLYWEAEYTTYGVNEIDLVQPVLTQNGTLGNTSTVAIYCASLASDSDARGAYIAMDGSTSAYVAPITGTPTIISFPRPTKLTAYRMKMSGFATYNGILYGSNDNSSYTPIATVSANTSADLTISIATANQGFYRYYKYISSAETTGAGYQLFELYLTGKQINQNYSS